MQKYLFILTVYIYSLPGLAGNVYIDPAVEGALTAMYGGWYGYEKVGSKSWDKIAEHYTSATVAMQGIYVTKLADRNALKNARGFGSAENRYYKRIHRLVKDCILPKVLTVSSLFVRHPDKAIYWGPYLYKVTEDVKSLCQQFQIVVTNNRVTFQDIAFLTLNDDLRQLFSLAQLGDIDWRKVWDDLSDLPAGINKEVLQKELNQLIGIGDNIATAGVDIGMELAQAFDTSGKANNDSLWTGKIKAFAVRVGHVEDALADASKLQSALQKIGKSPKQMIENLFVHTAYDIESFIYDYMENKAMGHYYKQLWYIEDAHHQRHYEETFDSYNESLSVFKARLEGKLKSIEADHEAVSFYIYSDSPVYYSEADESRMHGCSAVTFTSNCGGSSKIGEGSLEWKENGDHDNDKEVRENTRQYCFRSSLDSESFANDTTRINNLINRLNGEKSDLESRISVLSEDIDELVEQINSEQLIPDAAERLEALKIQRDALQSQLDDICYALEEAYKGKDAIMEDYSEETDEYRRIPDVMHNLETIYGIQWYAEGHWQDNVTYVRQGYMPSIKADLTFTAKVSITKPEEHMWLIGRIHRSKINVQWDLTSDYTSSDVIDRMELDVNLSDKEKQKQVNQRLHDLSSANPDCTITIDSLSYDMPEKEGGIDEPVHLLWASDRLQIARQVEYRLSKIYANLVLTEKFMYTKDNILTRFLNQTLIVPSFLNKEQRTGIRNKICRRAFRSWQLASRVGCGIVKPEEFDALLNDL